MIKAERDYMAEGEASYQRWREQLLADPESRRLYEEEAARSALWLQLVQARLDAGMTQAEMAQRLGVSEARIARIEKRGYDTCTLNTLRRYVQALGKGFTLDVAVRRAEEPAEAHSSVAG